MEAEKVLVKRGNIFIFALFLCGFFESQATRLVLDATLQIHGPAIYDRVNVVPQPDNGAFLWDSHTVRRIAPDFTFDTSFVAINTGPSIFVAINTGSSIQDVIKQPDGKILVGSYAYGTNGIRGFLARHEANGMPDHSFGTRGKVAIDNRPLFLASQSDNKIIVVTHRTRGGEILINRYTADGSYDNSFNTIRVNDLLDPSDTTGIKILICKTKRNNKIVLGGCKETARGGLFLMQFNEDGSLDHSFGQGGITLPEINDLEPSYLSVLTKFFMDTDERVLILARTRDLTFFIARFNQNGLSDQSFGTAGIVKTPFNKYADFTLQSNHKILLVGVTEAAAAANPVQSLFSVVRYNENGSLQQQFETDITQCKQLAVQENGEIVMLGYGENSAFSLRRYHEESTLQSAISYLRGAIPTGGLTAGQLTASLGRLIESRLTPLVRDIEEKIAEWRGIELPECRVCLEGITDFTRFQTPCRHLFHKACIDAWKTAQLPANPTCPLCRTSLSSPQPNQ